MARGKASNLRRADPQAAKTWFATAVGRQATKLLSVGESSRILRAKAKEPRRARKDRRVRRREQKVARP